jgi:tetratricopeptide (TPR) repeat protein
MSDFQHKDFMDLLQPKNLIDSVAMFKIEGLSWVDAHLLAAKTYLKRDDIENYLKHMNILLYQYPVLKDFNTVLTYYYNQNKIDMNDYTAKRVGIIQLCRGKYDDAIKYLTESYKLNPNDPLILYNLALAYSKKKDFKTALSIINQCLIANSKYPEANNLKRQILNQQ